MRNYGKEIEELERLKGATQANLDKGKFFIKEGHVVKGKNDPDGSEIELPLGPNQLSRKKRAIEELDDVIKHPWNRR